MFLKQSKNYNSLHKKFRYIWLALTHKITGYKANIKEPK